MQKNKHEWSVRSLSFHYRTDVILTKNERRRQQQ